MKKTLEIETNTGRIDVTSHDTKRVKKAASQVKPRRTIKVCAGCLGTMDAEKDGKPFCVVCDRIDPKAHEIIEVDLAGEPITCECCKMPIEETRWKDAPVPPSFIYHPYGKAPRELIDIHAITQVLFWDAGGVGNHCPTEEAERLKKEADNAYDNCRQAAVGHTFYCGCRGQE